MLLLFIIVIGRYLRARSRYDVQMKKIFYLPATKSTQLKSTQFKSFKAKCYPCLNPS